MALRAWGSTAWMVRLKGAGQGLPSIPVPGSQTAALGRYLITGAPEYRSVNSLSVQSTLYVPGIPSAGFLRNETALLSYKTAQVLRQLPSLVTSDLATEMGQVYLACSAK